MLIDYRGATWRLDSPTRTSDGFLIAWGWLLDDEGEIAADEDGNQIGHSFFLGRAHA